MFRLELRDLRFGTNSRHICLHMAPLLSHDCNGHFRLLYPHYLLSTITVQVQVQVLDGLSWNIIFEYSFHNLSKKFDFHNNLTRITGTLHEDQFTFSIISRSFLLRMRNISDRSCRENRNTHFIFSNFFPENRTVHEIMWKHIVQPGRVIDDNMAHTHCMLDT
jgi:hypothetical protein